MTNLNEAQERATNKFNKLSQQKVFCPVLWKEVKFTYEGFIHLSQKDAKHTRPLEEQTMRFLCFLSVEEIIKKSHLYQEYREGIEEIPYKKWTEILREKRIVKYYGFVAIVKVHNEKYRIRVVVKDISWFEHAEYLSVMPAWKMEGYRNFMWESL